MTSFSDQLFFGETPPEGYKREFTDSGVWYKPIKGRSRWWRSDYPSCKVEPCGDCGRFFPPTALYSGSFPQTRAPGNWIEGIDYGPGAYRHVCRACANRHDALHRRWSLYKEIAHLIRRLEKEIANVRRKANTA